MFHKVRPRLGNIYNILNHWAIINNTNNLNKTILLSNISSMFIFTKWLKEAAQIKNWKPKTNMTYNQILIE